MSRFSVVIPTRRRSDTLRYVVRNVLASDRDDLEVVVHHCGSDPATDAVIASVHDPRLRYFCVADGLSMRDNWEAALSRASGEYVTILGDDDGILPGALEIADRLIQRHAPELLSWRPATYFWPSAFDASLAGGAYYAYDAQVGDLRISAGYALRCLYRFQWHYSDMPMIYNSFVSRALIDRIRSRLGRYFQLNAPDVTSGVVNAMHCDEFLWSHYPLTVAGISKNSTGHRISMHADAQVKDQAIAEYMPSAIEQDWMPCIANLDFEIAVELLALRRALGGAAGAAPVDMADVAEYLARHLHRYPLQLDASREALRGFCERHGIDFEKLASRFDLGAARQDHTRRDFISSETNVFRAAHAIAAHLGPYREAGLSSVGFAAAELALGETPLRLSFSRNGNGPQYLEKGWNRPEAFGTWSCDHEATIRLPQPTLARADGRLRMEVAGRAAHSGRDARHSFSISVAGAGAAATEFSLEREAGSGTLELPVAQLPPGPIRITIRCLRLFNAALSGSGSDNRPLGFGLESLALSVVPHLTEDPPD